MAPTHVHDSTDGLGDGIGVEVGDALDASDGDAVADSVGTSLAVADGLDDGSLLELGLGDGAGSGSTDTERRDTTLVEVASLEGSGVALALRSELGDGLCVGLSAGVAVGLSVALTVGLGLSRGSGWSSTVGDGDASSAGVHRSGIWSGIAHAVAADAPPWGISVGASSGATSCTGAVAALAAAAGTAAPPRVAPRTAPATSGSRARPMRVRTEQDPSHGMDIRVPEKCPKRFCTGDRVCRTSDNHSRHREKTD